MDSTAGSRWRAAGSWALLGALGLFALRPACDLGPPDAEPFDSAGMLRSLGETVILPTLQDARAEALLLQVAANDWATAPDDVDALANVRGRWTSAMLSWQRAELMQVGPAGASVDTLGGQDLRDEVYSWPTLNPCRVDQELVAANHASADWAQGNLVNVYGLDALEYLLWHPGDNDCPPQVDINADGTWDALGDAGVLAARADYARSLADLLIDQVDAIITAWDPEQGDFVGQLAGDPGSVYGTEVEALNAVFDALFYLELKTKDKKLGVPAGLCDECADTPDPEAVESPWARVSVEEIAANLDGFEELFSGGDGLGFDDLLASIEQEDLADAILGATANAQAAAAAFEGPLVDRVTDDLDAVLALHAAVKAVTDLLKGDLATILVLQLPAEAGGDND